MAIDTGKILNMSIKDYAESKGVSLRELSNTYNLVGVHCDQRDISEFASSVPDEAEIVVNYQDTFFGAGAGSDIDRYRFLHHQIGVALIPKKL
ncbi:MAG: hypothetical protein PHH54_01695 [Candidatus Nanoarchaeia archaeon]|nr:hypothetical protein [Candidatus Nanoarchaeia archaeon]MDD5740675.1 hypothetical protein [Candidatus Nanoarchaeia archaeon]